MISPSGIASLVPGAPLQLPEVEKKKLQEYLSQELEDALDEHQTREARLDEYQRLYDAEPKAAVRNFPWPGAA